MDSRIIIHLFKGLKYRYEDNFDFSAEAGKIRNLWEEKLNTKSKTRKTNDVLADLSNAKNDQINEPDLNEDFLLTGKVREADDVEFERKLGYNSQYWFF